MDDRGVPSDEMRWIRPSSDPIDAVLGGEPPGELSDVAEICHALRSAYLPGEPLRRSPELAAFTQAHLNQTGDVPALTGTRDGNAEMAARSALWQRTGRRTRKMLTSVSAFVATLTGKVVVGTAVAVASVGGLHAADVIDVPGLPDVTSQAVEPAVPSSGDTAPSDGDPDLPDPAVRGQETAEERRDAAEAYSEAVQDWTACVSDNAAAQGDETTRTTGEFDPRESCGDRPQPGDFGLTDLPDQASDESHINAGERPDSTDAGPPGDRPSPPVNDTPADASGGSTDAPQDPSSVSDEPGGSPADPSDRGQNPPAGRP